MTIKDLENSTCYEFLIIFNDYTVSDYTKRNIMEIKRYIHEYIIKENIVRIYVRRSIDEAYELLEGWKLLLEEDNKIAVPLCLYHVDDTLEDKVRTHAEKLTQIINWINKHEKGEWYDSKGFRR